MSRALSKDKKVNPMKGLFDAISNLNMEKDLSQDDIIETIKSALLAAYVKRNKTSENVQVIIDKEKSEVYFSIKKTVVTEVILNGMQIHIEDAQKIDPNVKLGDEITISESPADYSRVAIQTAGQVALYKLRSLNQKKIKDEYTGKIGELINGYIQRKKGDMLFLDLGKVEAIMPYKHQIPGEKYRVDDKIKVFLYEIDEQRGRPLRVVVSRSHKKFVQKLFEMEVPEIYEGIVKIREIGRVPGIRTKVVVESTKSDVDAVGACVGVRGVRIQAIVRELGAERIDIVQYVSSHREFIINAIHPAEPTLVKFDPVTKEALVVVADKDLSLAIGKEGANVKIASYITGFKIDVKSESEFSQDASGTPDAKRSFDQLFSDGTDRKNKLSMQDSEDEELTPLSELPGLTKRVLNILYNNNIKYIEDILNYDEQDLINIEEIGEATAKQILEIIYENVELEEVTEETP